MTAGRIVLVSMLCGAWFVAANYAFDRELPDRSAAGWVVFFAGFLVIFTVIELAERTVKTLVRRRHGGAAELSGDPERR